MQPCICFPEKVDGARYIQWIGTYFGDCIYGLTDQISFYAGLAGIAAYAVSMFPQLYKNYQRKAVDGLSAGLVLLWLFGDISNLIGTVLLDQFPTQQLTASYFIATDIAMVTQYVYYKYVYKQSHQDDIKYEPIPTGEGMPIEDSTATVDVQSDLDDNHPHSKLKSNSTGLALSAAGSVAALVAALAQGADARNIKLIDVFVDLASVCNVRAGTSGWKLLFGCIMAWVSGLLYFTSRIPQVIENYKRKSVQGVSMFLFILTIFGNLGYGLSIILRFPVVDAYFWAATFPYILGALGVLVFDVVIFSQAIQYDGL
ncbi:hypothetical protein QVD99_001893 [Batrachochytrium dendrobatidis]|nr:hypothetical protein QVD99_001893 [Batrachochytrium dendrobatidis]